MLNLVQLQERLKDVPMQALMQYANGTNPQVPPFLALGELNRRKKMQESAAAQQAQEMEGAPTVKQQIEQAAGLMALQGNRQRQAAQQQQSVQANMPMAAPNTTTSEPAQLAGGGFIDDIVVPRDYQGGGMAMNPDMIKKLMMLKAMKQRRPGIAGLPADNIRRADYANGGIVAFAGQDGSFVETNPGFYQLKEETDQADEIEYPTIENLTDEERLKRLRELQRLAGVKKDPYFDIKQLYSKIGEEDRARRGQQPMDQLTSFLTGIAEGRGGNWATQGARGAKASMQLRTAQEAANRRQDMDMAALQMSFAKEEDARARGDAAAVIAEKDKQNKLQLDIAAAKRQNKYYDALIDKARSEKKTNLDKVFEAIELAKREPTPENIRRANAMKEAAGYVTYAAPRIEQQYGAEQSQSERVAVQEYNKMFDPKKLYTGPLADDLDAAAARDKKEGTGTRYQDQIRLREYNRIREGLSLPPVSRLPGSTTPTGGSTQQGSQADPLGIRR